jgi:phenylalanyl-tRNA synthetase beta chain
MKASMAIMRQLSGASFPEDVLAVEQHIAAQIGAIEYKLEMGPLYSDALIVKVISAEPISGSDHLSLCWIDDRGLRNDVERGKDGLVQVVCGAPNVRADQIVVWLPPGSIVPSSAATQEPLKMSARNILGHSSNGMLASASELAISTDHSGIVELPEGTAYGTKLADLIDLNDTVFDIENKMFTHRPDLFGQLGIAREICATFGIPFKGPSWYKEGNSLKSDISGRLSVSNQLSDKACPRFMAVSIGKLKIAPSPLWLQSYLSRSGIRPLNNIVDITNYVMLITSQPLQAYDIDKIGGTSKVDLIVRNPLPNEKLTLLNGSEIELLAEDIVIANQDHALGLGGVMGGQDSEISDHTTQIVLESASFDMYRIRRSSMAHGVFSEAVTRFTKGPSPLACQPVLTFAVELIKQLCPEAEIISEVVDVRNDALVVSPAPVSLELKLLESYLGIELEPKALITMLANAGIEASIIDERKLIAKPPFWRTDLSLDVDIIEEISRLYGFDRLPQKLPQRLLSAPLFDPIDTSKHRLRASLAAAGANEVFSYSFVNRALIEATGQDPVAAYKISNALSPELEYYRLSLIPSLLSGVHQNHKAGYDRFSIFEIGKVHHNGQFDDQGLPIEAERLALVFSADAKSAKRHYQGEAFYQARSWLNFLIGSLDCDPLELLELMPLEKVDLSSDQFWSVAAKSYRNGRAALIKVNSRVLGIIGEFSAATTKGLKLPDFCSGFELDLRVLSDLSIASTRPYHELSRFPKVMQDLTVSTEDKSYSELQSQLIKELKVLLSEDVSYAVSAIDAYKPPNEQNDNTVAWTFRLTAQSSKRTLTDKEITNALEKLKSKY